MIEKTILDCGLVIISETIPRLPSFAMSYSLKNGSRTEAWDENGIHHMVEHMMFKGTEKYDLKRIADISDRLGGRLNAFTGKEMTQYYIKAIGEKLPESFDLISDMVFDSCFPAEEFEKEQNVVIQEIRESMDNPEVVAFESFYGHLFGNNGAAFPIAGGEEQVNRMTRQRVFEFYKEQYRPQNLLLAAVGNIQHQDLVALAKEKFSAYPKSNPNELEFSPADFHFDPQIKSNSSLNQLYVIVGFKGLPLNSRRKYEFMVMNDILGAGMSSRLFQRIREEDGLSYTVSSFHDGFWECGVHIVYSVVEPYNVDPYLKRVGEEITTLKTKGVTSEELGRSKDHIKSTLLLGLEGNISKMRFNVNKEFYLKRSQSIEEILDTINSITVEDVNRIAEEYLDLNNHFIFIYGKTKQEKGFRLTLV